MTYVATVTQKGQVTIPLPIREALSIKPYEKVVFIHTKNTVIIRQAKTILDLKGSVRPKKDILYSDKVADTAFQAYTKKEYERKKTR